MDELKLLVKGTDKHGYLKDWHGFAKNKCEWRRMIAKITRVEKGEFGDSEDETTEDAEHEHGINANNSTPRRQVSNCDSRCRQKTSPNRKTIEPTIMRRRQAIWILNCDHDENPREVRRKYRMLA